MALILVVATSCKKVIQDKVTPGTPAPITVTEPTYTKPTSIIGVRWNLISLMETKTGIKYISAPTDYVYLTPYVLMRDVNVTGEYQFQIPITINTAQTVMTKDGLSYDITLMQVDNKWQYRLTDVDSFGNIINEWVFSQ